MNLDRYEHPIIVAAAASLVAVELFCAWTLPIGPEFCIRQQSCLLARFQFTKVDRHRFSHQHLSDHTRQDMIAIDARKIVRITHMRVVLRFPLTHGKGEILGKG